MQSRGLAASVEIDHQVPLGTCTRQIFVLGHYIGIVAVEKVNFHTDSTP